MAEAAIPWCICTWCTVTLASRAWRHSFYLGINSCQLTMTVNPWSVCALVSTRLFTKTQERREATRSRFEVRSEMMTSCQRTHVAGWARRAGGGVSAAANGSGGLASLSPTLIAGRSVAGWLAAATVAPELPPSSVSALRTVQSSPVCHHVRVAVSVRRRRAPAISHRPYGGRPPAAHMSQVSPTSTLHYKASPSAPCYDIALQLVALSRAFHTTMHRTVVDLRLTVEMSRREAVCCSKTSFRFPITVEHTRNDLSVQ